MNLKLEVQYSKWRAILRYDRHGLSQFCNYEQIRCEINLQNFPNVVSNEYAD